MRACSLKSFFSASIRICRKGNTSSLHEQNECEDMPHGFLIELCFINVIFQYDDNMFSGLR